MEMHGRSLRAECAPGAGTAVTLHIPMIQVIGTADPGAAVAATQQISQLSAGFETVMKLGWYLIRRFWKRGYADG